MRHLHAEVTGGGAQETMQHVISPGVERLDSGRDVGVTARMKLENPAFTTPQLPDRLRGVEGVLAVEPPGGVGVELLLLLKEEEARESCVGREGRGLADGVKGWRRALPGVEEALMGLCWPLREGLSLPFLPRPHLDDPVCV